jgi:hypothetical protein
MPNHVEGEIYMGTPGVDTLAHSASDFERTGYSLSRDLVGLNLYEAAKDDLLALAERLLGTPQSDVDSAWNYLRATDRRTGSLLYNAAKLLPTVHRISSSLALLSGLRSLGMLAPAIVDVNFRIDSYGEEKFLFGWHQDYWFSICSPAAIVAWIPLTDVREAKNGGVEVIPRDVTGGRILKTREGDRYSSYADAILIDEEVPASPKLNLNMNVGDVLFFRFDVLHRSLPVLSKDRSRWTLQVRFADLADEAFRAEQFKPGVVTPSKSTYAERTK